MDGILPCYIDYVYSRPGKLQGSVKVVRKRSLPLPNLTEAGLRDRGAAPPSGCVVQRSVKAPGDGAVDAAPKGRQHKAWGVRL